ncbi:MAG TPA: rRNA maturation RNase YbeY [Sulfurospirillum sp. UBA11407]|jgi:probable rRNA maturation factor|nr:MAG TPA: rRNA maturation RNase YbeY [Sulfurospirillum sp. UBA11407]DAB34279.1 MAG TPA: rRNA maturation RNase YbeY [Sulfurospirillum sp. UBA12182]
MIHLDIQAQTPLDLELLEKLTQHLTQKDVELIFLDEKSMHEINLEYRGVDKTTDVLSFPLDEAPYAPLGSILINVDLAKQKALEYAHKTEEEIALLYIHGLLHLLGYDHEVDSGQMRQKEEELISLFCLPQSLIVRTDDL